MINVGEPVTLEDVEQVIRKVDKNGDGAIDYDEFTKVTPHPKHKPPPTGRESLELLHAPALLLSAGATLPTPPTRAAVLASQVIMDEAPSSLAAKKP
jgi:hypothetical protein